MKFTLDQTSLETGKLKSTISTAINSVRLSASKAGNKYEIDTSELFRVLSYKGCATPKTKRTATPPQHY